MENCRVGVLVLTGVGVGVSVGVGVLSSFVYVGDGKLVSAGICVRGEGVVVCVGAGVNVRAARVLVAVGGADSFCVAMEVGIGGCGNGFLQLVSRNMQTNAIICLMEKIVTVDGVLSIIMKVLGICEIFSC